MHANKLITELIDANCLTFFFISSQAVRESCAGDIGRVIPTTTLSENATIKKVRNTAGKAFNMASHVTALHNTMEFRFKAEFGDEIGLQKYLAWKHTWHTEVGKLSPSCKPKESLEYKAWQTIEANPACQPDGSDNKEAWRKQTSC